MGLVLALGLLHDENVSATRVRVEERSLVLSVDVGLDGLQKVVRLPAEPADLSEAQLESARAAIVDAVTRWVRVTVNGRPAALEAGALEPMYEPIGGIGEPAISRVRLHLTARVGEPIGAVDLSLDFFSGLTSRHRALVAVSWADRTREYARTGPAVLEITYARLQPTVWTTAADFCGWGLEHIFIGVDHLAFLAALLVAAGGVGSLVRIVTSFTVAHSLTLLVSAMGWIHVSPRVTEAMIAASIVYVAAENFFIKGDQHRWVLTFAFGLVHGLGFAGVLREKLIDLEGRVGPILWFNLGVELGQVAIVLGLYPALAWVRRRPEGPHRRLVHVFSSLIFLLGMAWLMERMAGWELIPG